MEYEIIDTATGVVVNSIAWDGIVGITLPQGCIAIQRDINVMSGIGYKYEGGQFIPPIIPQPTPIVPSIVSRFQARAALVQAGYFTQVDDYMMALPKTDIKRMAWEDAENFDRTSTTLQAMAELLNLSSTDLDNLFVLAASIQA